MSTLHSDTHPRIAAMQRDMLRWRSPAQRLAMVGQMYETVKTLALSGLKSRYPNDSPAKLKRRLADLMLGRELALKVYGSIDDVED